MRHAVGDAVVVNEKLRPMVEYQGRGLQPGLRGIVLEITFEHRRRGVQWVGVEIKAGKGNSLGYFDLPSNWLDPEGR